MMNIANLRDVTLALNIITAISVAITFSPSPAHAHRKGIYANESEARKQAEKIGCADVHQNNGRWMPCVDERELHQQMRRQ